MPQTHISTESTMKKFLFASQLTILQTAVSGVVVCFCHCSRLPLVSFTSAQWEGEAGSTLL